MSDEDSGSEMKEIQYVFQLKRICAFFNGRSQSIASWTESGAYTTGHILVAVVSH